MIHSSYQYAMGSNTANIMHVAGLLLARSTWGTDIVTERATQLVFSSVRCASRHLVLASVKKLLVVLCRKSLARQTPRDLYIAWLQPLCLNRRGVAAKRVNGQLVILVREPLDSFVSLENICYHVYPIITYLRISGSCASIDSILVKASCT